MKWVLLCVAVYLGALAAWYPRVITVSDESRYVQQASLFSKGQIEVERVDPISGISQQVIPSRYAPGTSALMAPLVRWFGWRGAFVIPAISIALATIATGLLLSFANLSPLWSLLVLVYPPSLVMGRIGMSDAPSMAAVAITMLLFWRGISGHGIGWFAAGLLAALSALLRDTNLLLFAPFVVGSLLRRERKAMFLILGGLLGASIWATVNMIVFGRWFNRLAEVSDGMSLAHLVPAMATGAIALLVMLPGGLVTGFAYRGPRHAELRIGVALFITFNLLWCYSGQESGLLKGSILGGRLYMPVVPLLAFTEAMMLERFMRRASTGLLVTATASLAFIVHPVMDHFGRAQSRLAGLIYQHTSADAVVITNTLGTGKYFDEARGHRQVIDYSRASCAEVNRILSHAQDVKLVFIYRTDSDFWLAKSREYDQYLAELESHARIEKIGALETASAGNLVIFAVKQDQQ